MALEMLSRQSLKRLEDLIYAHYIHFSQSNSREDLKFKFFNSLIVWIQKFGHLGLQFAKGGQISIDCFPTGFLF